MLLYFVYDVARNHQEQGGKERTLWAVLAEPHSAEAVALSIGSSAEIDEADVDLATGAFAVRDTTDGEWRRVDE